MTFGNNGRSGALDVAAEQNHRRRCFPKDTSKRGISHALYKTDKALLFNPTRRPDVCHFSRARRSGAPGGRWPLSATPQHRRLHHSPDRLRNSTGGNALARGVSKSCTGGVGGPIFHQATLFEFERAARDVWKHVGRVPALPLSSPRTDLTSIFSTKPVSPPRHGLTCLRLRRGSGSTPGTRAPFIRPMA
jgi:hypothetical protein